MDFEPVVKADLLAALLLRLFPDTSDTDSVQSQPSTSNTFDIQVDGYEAHFPQHLKEVGISHDNDLTRLQRKQRQDTSVDFDT